MLLRSLGDRDRGRRPTNLLDPLGQVRSGRQPIAVQGEDAMLTDGAQGRPCPAAPPRPPRRQRRRRTGSRRDRPGPTARPTRPGCPAGPRPRCAHRPTPQGRRYTSPDRRCAAVRTVRHTPACRQPAIGPDTAGDLARKSARRRPVARRRHAARGSRRSSRSGREARRPVRCGSARSESPTPRKAAAASSWYHQMKRQVDAQGGQAFARNARRVRRRRHVQSPAQRG